MYKVAIIFSIIGAVLFIGGSIIEKIQRKKYSKDDE